MPTFIKSTIIILALGLTTLYAGSGHSHDGSSSAGHTHAPHFDKVKKDLSTQEVKKAAKKEVLRLLVEKKIPKSWRSVPISKIGKTHYGDTDDWVVVFDNMKIKNKKRQTLYIFVSVHGDIRGANYTGN